MSYAFVSWVVWILRMISVDSVTYCNNERSCFGNNLAIGSDDLWCYGYFSCSEASVSTTYFGNFLFGASYSGYECNQITKTYGGNWYSIVCGGLYSCSKVDYLYNLRGQIVCAGELSCSESIIYHDYTSIHMLECQGDKACSNSDISGTYHHLYGSLAAQNSIFTGLQSSNYYWFYGSESGKNSTIYCGDGNTCYIYCEGNACNELTLLCDIGTNEGCTYQIDCSGAEYSDVCQNGYNVTYVTYNMASLSNVTMSSIENSMNLCNDSYDNSTVINSGDYQEYAGVSLDKSNNVNIERICCSAYQSCSSAGSIITNMNNSNNSVAIRCDGYGSCQSVSNIFAKNGGNIYLTGYDSGKSSTIEASDFYNIYCTATQSCQSSTIKSCHNVYGTGYYSCYAAIISNVENVFMNGYQSGMTSTISNVINNVYCVATYSCYQATISNVLNGSVYGAGSYSLAESYISHVYDGVIGLGYRALYGAQIINTSNVVCHGSYQACSNALIRRVNNIIFDGNDSGANATIISESINEMKVYINGVNNEIINLYCNETDLCKIECQSIGACDNLCLHCYDNCFVVCDATGSGIECPIMNDECGNYSVWSTNDPTVIPSTIPSQMPSNNPTSIPTYVPTYNPSHIASSTSTRLTTLTASNVVSTEMRTTMSTWTAMRASNASIATDSIDNEVSKTYLVNQSTLISIVLISCISCVVIISVIAILVCWTHHSKMKMAQELEMARVEAIQANNSSIGKNMQLKQENATSNTISMQAVKETDFGGSTVDAYGNNDKNDNDTDEDTENQDMYDNGLVAHLEGGNPTNTYIGEPQNMTKE